jgi:tRNA nucleotidyltransferase (CCA-adding enzyme)
LALAGLLHSFISAVGVAEVCRRWKLSNRDARVAAWLVEHQAALVGARHMAWPRLQRILISEDIADLVSLSTAIAAASGQPVDDVEHCRRLLELPPERLNPPAMITGDDLIAHGVPRGKRYHMLLEAVRDAQLEGKVSTAGEALELVDHLLAQQPPEN